MKRKHLQEETQWYQQEPYQGPRLSGWAAQDRTATLTHQVGHRVEQRDSAAGMQAAGTRSHRATHCLRGKKSGRWHGQSQPEAPEH